MLHDTRRLICLTLAACAVGAVITAKAAPGVQLETLSDRIKVTVDGQLFTEYLFKNVPRPFCYPVMGPGNLSMTRNWPMKNVPDEEHDHPHHRGIWYSHGYVNGQNFWAEATDCGKIVHDSFAEVKSGKDAGVLKARNKWVAADGKLVMTDERTLTFHRPGSSGERIMDFDITLQAPKDHEVVMGDTKEGTMGIRVAETMRLRGKVGKGHIVTSEGATDRSTWGKRAKWCDYYGPVEGKTVGVAIFDHPSNPRHPTWWHVRDYGLFAANPFGKHDFENLSNTSAGELKIPAGQSVTFRYRFYFHPGDEREGKVAQRYDDYVKFTAPQGTGKP